MTVGYFDSSALVKLLLEEDGRQVSLAVWDAVDTPATSGLAYPEVRAALAAASELGLRTAPAHAGDANGEA
jgi:predicted nucleic acid-binding protein